MFGFVTHSARQRWQDAPLQLPHFQFYEKHRAVIRTTQPDNILPIVASFDVSQDAIVNALMSIRQLPQKMRRSAFGETLKPFGLHSFTLLEQTPSELCYGLRGQFWRSDFGLEAVPDRQAYDAVLPPGHAKLLLRYRVTPLGGSDYELCTETYIDCADRAARVKMTAYWLAIRLGSGWIRLRTLKAVQRELQNMGCPTR